MAALKAVIPGGEVLMGHNYRPAAVLVAAAEVGEHVGSHMAEGSTASKFALRLRTGVPMTLTSKLLTALTALSLAKISYDAMSEARKEYKACMEY